MYTRIRSTTGAAYETAILRDADGWVIPDDPDNLDWRAYQAWLAAGNTPSDPPAPAASTQRTFLAFMALFTAAEQTAIATSTNGQVRLFCLEATGATFVDLADPRTVAGTQGLEALGLIAAGRAAQVLAGQAPPTS